MLDKRSLRAEYRAYWRSLGGTLSDRAIRSESIVRQLSELLGAYPDRCRIGAYMALPDEPELMSWLMKLDRSYEVSLPRVEGDEMHFYSWDATPLEPVGAFGVREPRDDASRVVPQSLDLIIVPGVVFDKDGYRLGRGKGYYDRYLPQTSALTVGVTLGLMKLDSLPRDPWDRPVDIVLSPSAPPFRE